MALADALHGLLRLPGATYSCVVERDSGRVLAEVGRAESGAADSEGVVPYSVAQWGTAVAAMFDTTSGDELDDVMIAGRRSYHLVRPLGATSSVLVYLRLDRARSNLAVARRELAAVRWSGAAPGARPDAPAVPGRAQDRPATAQRNGASPAAPTRAGASASLPAPAARIPAALPPGAATPARGQRRTAASPPSSSLPAGALPSGSVPAAGGPSRSGPTRSGPTRSGPTRSGPTRSGPTGSGPTGSGPPSAVPARSGSSRSGSSRSGPSRSGPSRSGPSRSGPSAPGSASVPDAVPQPPPAPVRQIPLPRRASGAGRTDDGPRRGDGEGRPRAVGPASLPDGAAAAPDDFAVPAVLGQTWAQDPGTLRRLIAGLRRLA